MLDLHCHLLPGIDDGPADMAVSLAMARIAVADGITTTACTPHILPGVYNNDGAGIGAAIDHLREALAEAGIPLRLVAGADAHVAPNLIAGLSGGRSPPSTAPAISCSSRPITCCRRGSRTRCSRSGWRASRRS